MKIIKRILIIVSAILIILMLFFMDFSDLSWSANKTNYLGLLACMLNIWGLLFLIKDKNNT